MSDSLFTCPCCGERGEAAEFFAPSVSIRFVQADSFTCEVVTLGGAEFDGWFPPVGLRAVTTEGCVRTVQRLRCLMPAEIDGPWRHGWIDEDGAWWPTTALVALPPAESDAPHLVPVRLGAEAPEGWSL